jgi:hypothetical protein
MGQYVVVNRCRRIIYNDETSAAGVTTIFYDVNDVTGPDNDVKTTYSNPSWRIQIAKRQDAGRAYSLIKNEYQLVQAKCHSTGIGPKLGKKAYGKFTYVGYLGNWPSTNDALRDRALTTLKRKLKKRVGNADALTPLAESRELRGLVRSAAGMATGLLETLIDIKRTKGASALKYASDAWLSFSFGIRPLVDDTKKIAAAIGNYLDRGDAAFREVGSAKMDWISTSDQGGNQTPNFRGGHCYGYSRTSHSLSYRYYCGGHVTVRSAQDYGIGEHLGFEFGNLPSVFWELIPYSWVVDYFTNVGNFLDDTFWVLPGSVTYSGYNRRYESRTVVDWTWKNPSPTEWAIQPTNGQSIIKRMEFERTPVGNTLSTVGLRVRSIDEIGIYGVNKLLNLASVFIQRKM